MLPFCFHAQMQITAVEYNYNSMKLSLLLVFPLLANISISAIIYTYPFQTQRILNTRAISFEYFPQYNYRPDPLQSLSDQKHSELYQKILKQFKQEAAKKNQVLPQNKTKIAIPEKKILTNVTLLPTNVPPSSSITTKPTQRSSNMTSGVNAIPIPSVTYQIRSKKQNTSRTTNNDPARTQPATKNQSIKIRDQANVPFQKVKNEKQQSKGSTLNRGDDETPVSKSNASVNLRQQKLKGKQSEANNRMPEIKLQIQGDANTNLIKQGADEKKDIISLSSFAHKIQIENANSNSGDNTAENDFTQKILAALRNGTLGMADPNDNEFEFLKREDSKDLVRKIIEQARNFTLGNIPFE